jgi:hypothetical protein
MSKYIIEYTAGTKGDLLCRFLNNFEPKFIGSNRTEPVEVKYINWLKLANPNMLTLDRFEEVLFFNTNKYVPAHCLWVTVDSRYVELLNKYDYKIIKLLFEPKHFITVRIESILKNMVQDALPNQIIDLINFVWFRDLDWNTFTLGSLNNRVKQINKHTAWFSRCAVFKLFIENANENKEFISYSDLYLNFNCDILKGYDLDQWKGLVEKSWCVYDGEGYRDWNLKTPNHWLRNDYSDTVERYLKEWKTK